MIEVTCAIIMDEDKVLIAQRSNDMAHAMKWEFPGGKLKSGESPERGVIREIREELGAEISVDGLLPSVTYDYETHSIKLIPFICSLDSGEVTLKQHADFRWISKSEVTQYDILEADLLVIDTLNGQWG